MHKNKKFSSARYFLSTFLILSRFSNFYAGNPIPIEQKVCDKMRYDLNQMETEIEQVVTALNTIGIKTTAFFKGNVDHTLSCPWIDAEVSSAELDKFQLRYRQTLEEIELDYGLPYSWIDIEVSSVELDKFHLEYCQIWGEIEIEYEVLKIRYPDLSYCDIEKQPEAKYLCKLRADADFVSESYRDAKTLLLQPLGDLLIEFYKDRNNCRDAELVLLYSIGRLHSKGANKQIFRLKDEQALKLAEYREEMAAFALFLNKKIENLN